MEAGITSSVGEGAEGKRRRGDRATGQTREQLSPLAHSPARPLARSPPPPLAHSPARPVALSSARLLTSALDN